MISSKRLPSHAEQVGTICRHEIRKLLRSKRVIGVMAIAALASYAITNIIGSAFDPSAVTGLFIFAIMLSPVLLVITGALVGSDSLLAEFHEKTGYSLFPNPVSRTAIWFGKFLAAELIVFIIITIYYGIVSLAAFAYNGAFQEFLIVPMLFSFVVATMIMSLSFLASSIFRGPIGVAITVLFSLLVLPALDGILASQQIPYGFTPSSAVNNINSMLLLPYNEQMAIPLLFDSGQPIGISIGIIAAYTIASSVASIHFFKKRDM